MPITYIIYIRWRHVWFTILLNICETLQFTHFIL